MSETPLPARETIAARSTPAGPGFRAMVRVSGVETFPILKDLLDGPDLDPVSGGSAIHARFRLGDSERLPVRVLCFRAPRSYTGEDVAEIHLPGAPPLAAWVLESIFARGARPAGPGEFTRRAYLAGRIDLTRAEGIQALIAARDDAERRGALSLTGGKVAGRVEALREALLTLLADLEATLDFPEHEVDPATLPDFEERLSRIEAQLSSLIRGTRGDTRPAGAPRAILWGRPNAGKSTLFNRLVDRDRVATSERPGTTRDVLGGCVRTKTGEILVFDAPGVGLVGGGEADAAALKTAKLQRDRMDLRLVVADVADPEPPPDPGSGDRLLVLAKTDLPRRLVAEAWIREYRPAAVVEVSSVAGTGMDDLRNAIGDWLLAASPGQDVVVAAERLRALFLKGLEDLDRVRTEHARGLGPECLSIHLRALLSALEEVTGRVFTEELLDSVFSRFCIGK